MIHSSVVEVSRHFLFLIPRKSLRFRFLRRRLGSLMKAWLTMLNMGVLNPADLLLVLGGLRRRSPAPENAVLCSAEISDVIWCDAHPKKSATQRHFDKFHGTSRGVNFWFAVVREMAPQWLTVVPFFRLTKTLDTLECYKRRGCHELWAQRPVAFLLEGFDATRAQDESAWQSYQTCPTAADARNNEES